MMPYSDTVFLDFLMRAEQERGETKAEIRELKATVIANAEAAAVGRKEIHKRLDRIEDKTQTEFKELRNEMSKRPSSPFSTERLSVLGSIFKVISLIYTNWPAIAWSLVTLAAIFGIKNPEFLKAVLPARP